MDHLKIVHLVCDLKTKQVRIMTNDKSIDAEFVKWLLESSLEAVKTVSVVQHLKLGKHGEA